MASTLSGGVGYLVYGGGYSILSRGGTPSFWEGFIDDLGVVDLVEGRLSLAILGREKADIDESLQSLPHRVGVHAARFGNGGYTRKTLTSPSHVAEHAEGMRSQAPVIEVAVYEGRIVQFTYAFCLVLLTLVGD